MRKFISLCVLSLLPAISAQTCKYDTPNGHHYDLSQVGMSDMSIPLVGPSGDVVYLRACGSTNSCEDSSVCIGKQRFGQDSLFVGAGSSASASWSSLSENGTTGVSILYSNGERCDGSDESRKTRVNFYCSESTSTQSNAKDDGCLMTINVQTPHACPLDTNEIMCSSKTEIDDCMSTADCACGWCSGKCIPASNAASCEGNMIVNCQATVHSHGVRGFVLATCILAGLFMCLCALCVCSKRREQKKRLARNLNLPNRFSAQPPQVQYVYVPMQNFGDDAQNIPMQFYPQMQGMQGVQYFMPQVPQKH